MRRSHGTGKHTAMNRALRAPGRYAHGSMESHLEDAATPVCNEPIGGPSPARDFSNILKRRSVATSGLRSDFEKVRVTVFNPWVGETAHATPSHHEYTVGAG
jgi:hypothetical protein